MNDPRMRQDAIHPWNLTTDDDLVTRLIDAIQRATVQALIGTEPAQDEVGLPAPEVATALLNLLASVLETAPECVTSKGMRLMSEAAGKELLSLIRGVRELKRTSVGAVTH